MLTLILYASLPRISSQIRPSIDPPCGSLETKKERKKAKGNNKRNGRWKLDKLDLRDAFFSARVVHLSFSNPEGGMTLHECIARP